MPRVTEDTTMSNDSYSYSDGAQVIAAAPEVRVDGREFARALQRFATNIFTTVLDWQERARQRRRLSELDDLV